jgi:hypothetical protein
MEWQDLKNKIYYLDGSLRDIYVNNVTKNDWQIWIDFVSKNYRTSFHIYEPSVTADKIDFSVVLDYWNGIRDNSCMATVYIDDIIIKAYFFDNNNIENDLTPTEINSIDDHNKLLEYMKGISKVLNKQVVLTSENEPDNHLITVDNYIVEINS